MIDPQRWGCREVPASRHNYWTYWKYLLIAGYITLNPVGRHRCSVNLDSHVHCSPAVRSIYHIPVQHQHPGIHNRCLAGYSCPRLIYWLQLDIPRPFYCSFIFKRFLKRTTAASAGWSLFCSAHIDCFFVLRRHFQMSMEEKPEARDVQWPRTNYLLH